MTILTLFISKSADKALPFFSLFRGNTKFEWGNEESNDFIIVKEHLRIIRTISRLEMGDTL